MIGKEEEQYSSLTNFLSRSDLKKYKSESWGLFALELKFNIDDIDSMAAESITDGKNDKKCDFIFINKERKHAVVGQNYFSTTIKKAAKKNKASDLNTAVGWVLSRNLDDLPPLLVPQVRDLRNFLLDGTIKKLDFWYIHNCHEHSEISDELITVELSARQTIEKSYGKDIIINAMQIGIETIEQWYKASNAPILVNDTYRVKTLGGYSLSTENWKVFSTAVQAKWLYKLFKEHNEDLFSANVRSYLGSRKSESNINNGIKDTVIKEPCDFLVFNNGITALVHSFELEKRRRNTRTNEIYQIAVITGISIVNGAQTTGAIGSLTKLPDDEVLIPIRFIECSSPAIIGNIIRFNNSQNTVQVSDFRSTDVIQTRLREEFKKSYPDVTYLGGRRGNGEDVIKRARNLLVSDQVAQSLTAFHGDPKNATHYKSTIWESDDLYSNVFNENVTCGHIVVVYSLYKTLLDYKLSLKELSKKEKGLTASQIKILEFLSHSGSVYIIIASIAASFETILARKVGNLFDIKFKYNISYQETLEYWNLILPKLIPFVPIALAKSLETQIKNQDIVNDSIQQFVSLVESTRDTNGESFNEFASKIIIKKATLS